MFRGIYSRKMLLMKSDKADFVFLFSPFDSSSSFLDHKMFFSWLLYSESLLVTCFSLIFNCHFNAIHSKDLVFRQSQT